MDTAQFETTFQTSEPLGKRPRFSPDETVYMVSPDGNYHSFDSPLLSQLSERMPTPAEIERELLQSGMRIRKSVTTAFTPRPFFNMNRLSPETQAALCSGPSNRQPVSTATFCGINLAALAHINSTPVEEQKMWSYSTSHKRGYEGDSDSDDQDFMPQTPSLDNHDAQMAIPVDYFNINFDESEDYCRFAQSDTPTDSQVSGRRMAQPKSRRRQRPASQLQSNSNPFGQLQMSAATNSNQWTGHKRVTSCSLEANMSLNNFGNAPFLQRRDDVDMDCS